MATVPMNHGLLLAGILFALGLIGLLVRRNLVFMLMSIEIMLNAAGLAFVVAGSRWMQADGQVMFIFILAMAAAEVSVGLALLFQLYHRHQSVDADAISEMRGCRAALVVAHSCSPLCRRFHTHRLWPKDGPQGCGHHWSGNDCRFRHYLHSDHLQLHHFPSAGPCFRSESVDVAGRGRLSPSHRFLPGRPLPAHDAGGYLCELLDSLVFHRVHAGR